MAKYSQRVPCGPMLGMGTKWNDRQTNTQKLTCFWPRGQAEWNLIRTKILKIRRTQKIEKIQNTSLKIIWPRYMSTIYILGFYWSTTDNKYTLLSGTFSARVLATFPPGRIIWMGFCWAHFCLFFWEHYCTNFVA